LLCNLLLHDLDTQLNKQDIACVRYIDDFILFAPNANKARAALKSARKYLDRLGLDAYDPQEASDKADEGLCRAGFDFLGCRVTPDAIRPGKKGRQSLLDKVDLLLNQGLVSQRHIKLSLGANPNSKEDPSLLYTLWRTANTVKAWGASFSFCTDKRIFEQLDQAIDLRLEEFNKRYRQKVAHVDANDRRRLNGLSLAADTSFDERFAAMVKNRNAGSVTLE
jgi:RNA-directed DNA polymerase